MKLTAEQRQEAARLCGEATAGPWIQAPSVEQAANWWGSVPDNAPQAVILAGEPQGSAGTPYAVCCTNDDGVATEDQVRDAAFIANARTTLPAALEDIAELEGRLEITRKALEDAPHNFGCDYAWRIIHEEPCEFWTKHFCLLDKCVHGIMMYDACHLCAADSDTKATGTIFAEGTLRCHPAPCNCWKADALRSLSEPVQAAPQIVSPAFDQTLITRLLVPNAPDPPDTAYVIRSLADIEKDPHACPMPIRVMWNLKAALDESIRLRDEHKDKGYSFGVVSCVADAHPDTERLLERVAQITAHRACGGEEHDPSNGKLHGCCVVCVVPWPCKYAGEPPSAKGLAEND